MSQKKKKRERVATKKVELVNKISIQSISIRQIIKENWRFLVLLIVGTIILYFNSLHGDFVSDDYAAITQNPTVADIGSTIALGIRGFPSLINAIVASLFGVSSAIPFHVVSLLLFLVVEILAFLLVVVLFGRKIAEITLFIFAVLPIHVEAISWISGKPYLLNAIGVLWGLVLFALYDKTKKLSYIKYLFLSIPLMFYCEPVRFAAFVLLVPAMVLMVGQNTNTKSFWQKFLTISGLAALFVLFVLKDAIINRVTMVNSGYNASDGIFYNPFFQYPTSIAKYLQLLLVPSDLTLYHTMYIFPTWLNWSILIVYVVTVIYLFFRKKSYAFALAFIFLAAAASMAPVKVSWLVAERYMFLGSFGFCLLLGLILSDLSQIKLWLSWVVVIILCVPYSARVYLRNIDWQTNHNLWVNTCQVSPNSHNAWNNIGDDYDKLKQYENAIKGFTQSTVVKPDYADAYHNRANIFFKMNRLDLARDSYMTALKYSPSLYHSYLSLTQIDLMENNLQLALEHAQKAVQIQPDNAQSWYVAGVVLAQAGDKTQAIAAMKKALEISPGYTLAQQALNSL